MLTAEMAPKGGLLSPRLVGGVPSMTSAPRAIEFFSTSASLDDFPSHSRTLDAYHCLVGHTKNAFQAFLFTIPPTTNIIQSPSLLPRVLTLLLGLLSDIHHMQEDAILTGFLLRRRRRGSSAFPSAPIPDLQALISSSLSQAKQTPT